MTLTDLAPAISSALATEIEISPTGPGQAQLYVPFYFPDGDGLVIHLRETNDGRLEVTDKAHTFLHISYHTDVERLRSGKRSDLLERIRSRHGVQDRDGELVASVSPDAIGATVFSFVQALLEISDLRNLDKDTVQSTFKDDLRQLLTGAFPSIEIDYVDQHHDRRGLYPIPYLLNGVARPIAIFDVVTDENASNAVVVAQKHSTWRPRMHLVAIEREQEKLRRRQVAWLSDDFDKQFSALTGNETAITTYLTEQHDVSRQLGATSN